jgi:thiaminase (transcriptional activator TenA)
MPRFTDELRAAAGDQWTAIVTHRFTSELASGTIDEKVMRWYLIQDFRFLDSFVVLLASIIAHARSLSDRIPGCQFLAVITGAENTYFQRCFDALPGCSEEYRCQVPDSDSTIQFCKLMRDVAATGNLSEMLAVIVVCEWSYLSWAQRVCAEKAIVRDRFLFFEWIDLHVGPNFEAVVEYLRNLLDKEALLLNDNERATCKQRFLSAVQLELDFFEDAYSHKQY